MAWVTLAMGHMGRMAIFTSTWVFSCKFAAYFQNTFSLEHLWTVASGMCNEKYNFIFSKKFFFKLFT